MTLAPELARMISEFEDKSPATNQDRRHHEQYHKFQTTFMSDVKDLIGSFKDLSNVFLEDSGLLISLDTSRVMTTNVVDSVKQLYTIGRERYETFWRQRILSQEVAWTATIPQAKLQLMSYNVKPSRAKSDITSMKQDRAQYLQMLICAQAGRQIDGVFGYENKIHPPALTRRGETYFGGKADLLKCLEEDIQHPTEAPAVDGFVLDGFVILRLVTPGPSCTTFETYADEFISYIDSLCNWAS